MIDPVDFLCRLDHRWRSFGRGARCEICGLTWTLLLQHFRGHIACYQCLGVRIGKPSVELHHVGGEPSPIQLLIPGNLHRVVTFWQDLTWRGVVEPASAEAVRLDLAALLVFGSLLPAVR